MKLPCLLIFALSAQSLFAQVNVTIDLTTGAHRISPFIYGRNNSLSGNPGSGFSPDWTRLKDARVLFFREGGGNNSTKYNWRRKLSSHPDWYNNVYANDWDVAAQALQANIPHAQGMWSFQLIGKAAKTDAANFDDWNYNGSQWWSGVSQNLAGGGEANPAGGPDANTEGDPDLYLENWTADSTVGILDHWFDGLTLDKDQLLYWSMDNEVEIWNGTHDDVMPVQLTAEEFMQRYFEVAKKARAKFPEIKLVGPVPANEWQWYNWDDGIEVGGQFYPWLKYFIKRVAEEQQASGLRLLDVLDIHFYPSSSNASEVVQFHRVFFDKNYVYPEANGVKRINGGWDESQNKEYILERCKAWLNEYMGEGHGVTFGVSETGVSFINANTSAIWYASMLGEFMKHPEMEIFSPWHWDPGMWEVLHLFSRYNHPWFVPATSSDEEFVSVYPTTNDAADSLTVVLVNRSVNGTKSVNVAFDGYDPGNKTFQALQLSNLPASETFVSHTSNALQELSVVPTGSTLNVTLPPMSITSVLLHGGETVTALESQHDRSFFKVYASSVNLPSAFTVEILSSGKAELKIVDINGKVIQAVVNKRLDAAGYKGTVSLDGLPKGLYFLQLSLDGKIAYRKISNF